MNFFPQVIVINKTTSSDIKARFAKNYLLTIAIEKINSS